MSSSELFRVWISVIVQPIMTKINRIFGTWAESARPDWYNESMIKIVFMGSPDFALPSLRALANVYELVGVVTQPDRASGRGRGLKSPPVQIVAQEVGT